METIQKIRREILSSNSAVYNQTLRTYCELSADDVKEIRRLLRKFYGVSVSKLFTDRVNRSKAVQS